MRFSPSCLAISAIDRRMIVVEIGSSIGRAASPKAPPAAPDAAAIAVCSRGERAFSVLGNVATAARKAILRAAPAALFAIFSTLAGMNCSAAVNFWPIRTLRRPGRLGRSRTTTTRARTA